MSASTHVLPHRPDPQEEQEWIRRAKQGDRQAFTRLIDHYKHPVYYTALTLVGDHEDASDCAQSAFERAWRSLSTFEDGRPFLPWLLRIVRNLCYTHLERRARDGNTVSLSSEEGSQMDLPDAAPNPRDQLETRELEQQVWQAIAALRPNDREIVVLCDLNGLSYREIAETLEIPIGTVMSRLFNARQRLRVLLGPLLDGAA